MDGGVETAYMNEPYRIVPGEQLDPRYRGVLILPPGGRREKVRMLQTAARAGWQVGVHAVGDATNALLVRMYRQVNADVPIRDLRWNIMHGFLLTKPQLRSLRQMNVAVTVQDHPTLLGSNMVQWWGKKRAAASYPLRTEVRSGVRIAGGTDAPVVSENPFTSLWWMVTRNTLTSGTLGTGQAISVRDALRSYTMGSAYTQFADDTVGSLEVGKRADMVVLSQNLLTVPPARIRHTHALATFVDGKLVYSNGCIAPQLGAAKSSRHMCGDSVFSTPAGGVDAGAGGTVGIENVGLFGLGGVLLTAAAGVFTARRRLGSRTR